MLIAGIIKYAERTRSLYYSSLNILRESMLKKPDAGPDYVKIMKSYSSNKGANLPVRIVKVAEPDRVLKALDRSKKGKLTDLEIVLRAHNFFSTFKGLIVDLTFSSREKTKSREFFSTRSPEDAFKVIEVELNLMYEALFTKFSVVCTGLGYSGRFISFALVVASLAIFYTENKAVFDSVDIAITYILLWGAIALDIIAFLMLLHSNWFLVQIKKLPEVVVEEEAASQLGPAKPSLSSFKRLQHIFTRRWSESISQFDVIDYCLHPRSADKETFIGYFGLTNFLDSLTYVKEKPFSDELRDHIFEELHAKSELADDLDTAKDITSARGDWVLYIEGKRDVLSYILDFEYDQSLLLWHIATELCYNEEKSEEDPKASPNYRKISKIPSDYMIYLLVMQPTIMSVVTGSGEVSFRDTCAEAKRFFSKEGGYPEDQSEACKKILGVDTLVDPGTLKGDCKSVLFHGCILAKKLQQDLGKGKWKLMSKVWMELMSYATIHCRATTHAQQLRRGGELITHVWLLITHFGFGYRFPAVLSVYTKIIVEK